MRHRYNTRGIVLSRSPLGEASAYVTVLAPELGIVRARAQSVRRHGAKLAGGLVTLAESALILVRGKEEWRVAGALLAENWFSKLPKAARPRAARVTGLLLRFAPEDAGDDFLFSIFRGFLEALSQLPETLHESAEILAALRILTALGLDTGALPEAGEGYAPDFLSTIENDRSAYIARINRGIAASEL